MTEIAVCSDTGCQAWGADEVASRFEAELGGEGTNRKVRVKRVGCMGLCERGPLVAIRPHGIFYQRVSAEDVPEVVSETIDRYNILGRLLYADPESEKRFVYEPEIPFFAQQKRILLSLNGLIDPLSIEEAIVHGGYAALEEVLASWEPAPRSGSHRALRVAGSRRRRLPCRNEMAADLACRRPTQVRYLQRSGRRSRRIHGSSGPPGESTLRY